MTRPAIGSRVMVAIPANPLPLAPYRDKPGIVTRHPKYLPGHVDVILDNGDRHRALPTDRTTPMFEWIDRTFTDAGLSGQDTTTMTPT